jgi:hypothetical protein
MNASQPWYDPFLGEGKILENSLAGTHVPKWLPVMLHLGGVDKNCVAAPSLSLSKGFMRRRVDRKDYSGIADKSGRVDANGSVGGELQDDADVAVAGANHRQTSSWSGEVFHRGHWLCVSRG